MGENPVMTQWGFGLLFAYVGLGVSNQRWRRARLSVLVVTAVVVTGVFLSYGGLR
jgi:hypothetical protein